MFSVCHGGTWANPLHFSVYDVNEIGSTSKWVNQQHLILYVINEIGNTLHPCGSLTMATWNQSGAVEAWWAHNPQVPGSKPGSDIKPIWMCLEWISRVVFDFPNNKWENIFMDFNVCLPLAQ